MKRILLLSAIVFSQFCLNAQCSEFYDFSSNNGWTQIGTDVSITNGKVNFTNGATCSSQKRIHKPIGVTLDSIDTWSIKLKLFVDSLGSHSGQPSTGIVVAGLTAGTKDAFSDCPDINCTGYPIGNQDGVMAIYGSPNPATGITYYYIKIKDGNQEFTSPFMNATILKSDLYIEMEKTINNTVVLNVYSDSLYTNHIPNSPVSLAYPATVTNLNILQLGNVTRGGSMRRFWGSIDDLCFNYSVTTSILKTKSNKLDLKLFPNPTKGSLKISGINSGNLKIYDAIGNLILEKHNEFKLNLENLPKGVYFIQIVDSNNSLFSEKLIIN